MELRPYQTEAVKNLINALWTKQRVVLQSATGSGKSVIFTDLAQKAIAKGSRVLILTHRAEIFQSTIKHFRNAGIKVEPINPENKNIDIFAQVYVAMVETFHRRNLLLSINLIIIDEAHYNNFTKVMDDYPYVKTIGVTATPIGKHFFEYYQGIVQTISIKELINQGYLTPCKAYQMQDDISDLKKSGNDYSESSLYKHYNKRDKYIGVIQEYKKYAIGKPTIVFNVNIKHCNQMHKEFIQAGIRSAVVTSETSDEDRRKILFDFETKNIDVINSVGILTTGVDLPCTEVVIINRATTSLALWLQMQGRASRTYPGKKEFIVLDFGRNHDEHGLWVEDREWKLKEPRKKKDGVPPVKECPQCAAILSASKKVCDYCGHELPLNKAEIKQGIMVEMQNKKDQYIGVDFFQLNGKQLYQAWQDKAISFKYAIRIAIKTNQIYTFAEVGGYSKGWVFNMKNIYNK